MSAKSAARNSLLQNTDHGVFVFGKSIEDCNDVVCAALGLPRGELIGKSMIDLSPAIQADGTISSERWQRRVHAAKAGLPQWFQWQFRNRDGGTVHALVHLGLEPGVGEGCLLAQVHDLSLLRGAGWAREESEARLRHVLDNTKALIFAKDREGRYIFANHEMERAVRKAAHEIVGRTDRDLWRPELAERLRRSDLKVLEQRQAIELEVTDTFDGKQKTFHSFKFPLFDPDGNPYAVCGIATDISDRKRVEDALRSAALAVSSAEGATLFQELVRYLATILDVDCAFIATHQDDNPCMMRMLAFYLDKKIAENFDYPVAGTPCETIVGRSFRIYPSRLAETFPADADFKKLGFEGYAGFPLSDAQGRSIGVISAVSRKPLENAEFIESVLKIFAVRAMAELNRTRSDEALRVSEASYRTIFEASEDAILVHDWDTGAIVDVNPKACDAYGYTAEEMKRLNVGDLSSGERPYTLEDAVKLIEQAKTGIRARAEWHRRNKDGSLHWDEVLIRRAVIAGKKQILVFTREITERKEREEALRVSEDRLRATIEAALDCIITMDSRGRIVEFNPAAESCFGYRRDEAVGRMLFDLLIPERHREAHRRSIARYLESGHGPFLGKRIEVTAMRSDGSEFPAELAIAVAEGPEGTLFMGYLRDITERRRAEQQRAQLESQLRQAQKMEAIGHLTGGIAHDFNNLLTSIMGYNVLATERQAGLGDPKLAKYLEQARLSCERARGLIQQMLTFSRGQRGEPRPVSLTPLIGESVKLLRSSFPSTIEIETNFERDVPAVMWDPVQVDQVLLNLCINARDAMSGIGVIRVMVRRAWTLNSICASCRQGVSGDYVELCVADDGPGIPPGILDRMFEPFFTTKEVGKGSGMGLSTVHGIVHDRGGHVVIETAPGQGARFRVLLRPVEPSGRDRFTTKTEHGRNAPPGDTLAGHVMVVDDEEVVGEFMRDLLENWGLRVTSVRNALQARELFASAPDDFDLVITDQTMPKITGMELARALLAIKPDLPVILYTGFGEGATPMKIESCGIKALVRKPVEPQRLFTLLKAHLNRTPSASNESSISI